MSRILVVDNYDSFVFTIVGYLRQLGATCDVVRNNAVDLAGLPAFDGVLVSPGPGTPHEAGAAMEVIEACATDSLPMLGVCLGHQALGAVFGGHIGRAKQLLHGKTSPVEHDGTGVLAGLPSPFTATRYHSLVVDVEQMPGELLVNAWVGDVVMGVRHRELPLHGVQFHPESVLTQGGHRLLAEWLEMCGQKGAIAASQGLGPLVRDGR